MIDKTLATYAILDMLSEKDMDIIDVYIPLTCTLIVENRLDKIDRTNLKKLFKDRFGLEFITLGALDSILNRMRKKGFLNKTNGTFFVSMPEIIKENENSQPIDLEAQFNVLASEIIEYSNKEFQYQLDINTVETGILDFLNIHNAEIILDKNSFDNKLSKRKKSKTNIKYIISNYVLHANEKHPEKIELLLKLAKGHLISEIVTRYDFTSYAGKMKSVIVALDAPIIFNLLGLNGESNFELAEELMYLLKEQDVKFIIFNQNRNEVLNTLHDAARRIQSHQYDLNKSSRVLKFAVRNHKDCNFIKTKIHQVDSLLESWDIEISDAPDLEKNYKEIDMHLLTDLIRNLYTREGKEELEEYKEDLISTDVDTISYIFRLRGNTASTSLKNCKAIMITTNTAIAYASKNHNISTISHTIPPCVTDAFLSTILWANYPKKNSDLNVKLLMSQCYSNVVLDDSILKMYYKKVEEMQRHGRITKEQLVELTSTNLAINLLEKKTLNDSELFTDSTPDEILQEIEIRRNEKIQKYEVKEQRQDGNIKKFSHGIAIVVFWIMWGILFILFSFKFVDFSNWGKLTNYISVFISVFLTSILC